MKAYSISVTSFFSILYCSNSEYWPQKHAQCENTHSKILDVYVERQSAQKFIYLLFLCCFIGRLGKGS